MFRSPCCIRLQGEETGRHNPENLVLKLRSRNNIKSDGRYRIEVNCLEDRTISQLDLKLVWNLLQSDGKLTLQFHNLTRSYYKVFSMAYITTAWLVLGYREKKRPLDLEVSWKYVE
jgi:hypothetical protein